MKANLILTQNKWPTKVVEDIRQERPRIVHAGARKNHRFVEANLSHIAIDNLSEMYPISNVWEKGTVGKRVRFGSFHVIVSLKQ